MSRVPLDEKQSNTSQDYDVRDILAEYWAKATQDELSAPERRGLAQSSLDALRAEEQAEEGVRIYQPKKDREAAASRLSASPENDRAPEEAPLELSESAEEAPETETVRDGEKASPLRSARDLAQGLFARFRREKQPAAVSDRSAPQEDAEPLPSFDELVWGKKAGPVRVEEEPLSREPERPAVSEPSRRAPEPEVEIHIPEEELNGLSVNAILAEYWGGLEDETAPVEAVPLSRSARRALREKEQEQEPRTVREEKTSPFRFGSAQRKSGKEEEREKARFFSLRRETRPEGSKASEAEALPDLPEPSVLPVPETPIVLSDNETPAVLSPRQGSPVSAEEEALNLSVSEILSEFWAGYTEEEAQPAPPAQGPRSRREAARMRKEASPLPPTDAASSAAENELPLSRREKRSRREVMSSRPVQDVEEPDEEEERRPPRRARKQRRKKGNRSVPAPLPEETGEESSAPPPPPLAPGEAAATFGFLRRGEAEEKPVPAEPTPPESRPEPPEERHARRSRRSAAPSGNRETTDKDVDVSTMSVDDILAEYNDIFAALPEAASAIGEARRAESAEQEAPPAEPAPPAPARPAEARPGGRVSRMEEEARDFLRQMRSESFGSRREEAPVQGGLRRPAPAEQPAPAAPEEKPRPAPAAEPESAAMPSVTDASWSRSMSRLLGQDPAPPQPAAAAMPSSTEAPALRPKKPVRSYAIPSEEVDPRFNLSGERKSTMVFGGKELDLSADETYVPPKAASNVGFHWVAGEEDLPDQPLEKKSPLRSGKKKESAPPAEETVQTVQVDDRSRPDYAPDKDYEEEDDLEDPGAFPSFGQYLSGLISGLTVRLFGVRRSPSSPAGTMEAEDEDLGPEVSPAAASKYYGSFVTSLRMRVRIVLVLMAVLAWITLGLPVSGTLRSVQVASGMALAIQLTILLLGLDVVTGALVNLARGRFGADSLAVLSCILTCLDALSVCLGFMGTPHMPLCLISSLSFLGVLLSSLVSARGLRKALRVPAIGKRCYGVTAEAAVKGSGMTLLKTLRPPKGFVRRTEEAAPDEDAFTRVSPLLAMLCLLLALIVALAKHAFPEILYILTVLLSPAVPLTALLCFALPYLFGTLRIFHSGAAIAGWSGISDIGRSDNLIVTDRDLFPEGSVEIDTVRIFAEVKPETIISYAGTMICASGSDLAPCFSRLMEKNGCPMRRVEGFEYLSGGGMKGVIDGSVILCGGLDMMRLMNVRVPYRLVGKTTVLLAVDGILCGIFNMKYEGQPQVRKALVGLIRSNRHPVFAIRDFLVTPDMLSDCFEVATDGYDFPPYIDRFSISEATPSAGSKLAAVVCREGLGPLVHMADTGRSMYLAVRLNLALTVLAAVLGVIMVFTKLLSAGIVSSGYLLLFLLICAVPVALISVFLRL